MKTSLGVAARPRPIVRFLSATAASFVVMTGVAQANCTRTPFTFGLGTPETDTHWRIERGTSCAGKIHGGNGRTGLTSFHSLSVAQRASHGLAGVFSTYRYAYEPAAGFIGKDHFVVKVKFDTNGVNGETNINFDVDVVDKL